MKKSYLILLPIIWLFACTNSSVNETNSKINAIYSSKDKNDKVYVKEFFEFNKNDIGKTDSVDYYTKIKVQKLSIKNINQLCSKTKVSCLIFWAPWCTGCCKALKGICKEILKENKSQATFAFISISDNLHEIQKELYKSQYYIQTYALDSAFYKGTSVDDFPKLKTFLNELFPNNTMDYYIPLMLMIDQKKKLLAFDPIMDKEKIKTIIAKESK
ncbi:MAG: hypothetical protein HXX18_04655 [Bacteroidetes bacterium]|nr:hypothetical protein [Bacteroidota bacterium]